MAGPWLRVTLMGGPRWGCPACYIRGMAPIVAKPALREHLATVVLYPVAAFMVLAMTMGIVSNISPGLIRPGAHNIGWMAGVVLAIAAALWAMTWHANRHRYYALHGDRLVIGRSGAIAVRFEDVVRVRVGAPMPQATRKVARFNAAIGRFSAKNAGAAELLARQYAGTIVLDEGERSVVINLSTVEGGQAVLDGLRAALRERVGVSEYSQEERARFGKFVPGVYARLG